jgi:hypothetical protein
LLFQKFTIKHVERENDRGIKTQDDHKNTHPGTIKENYAYMESYRGGYKKN